MNNREVLNESFFGLGKKKKSYLEKLKGDLGYAPVDPRTKVATIGGVANPVTDIDIVKKRLTSAFGAAFGNNTVKSLTNKSIKKFPIVVSENIDPNTLIYIKKLLEDQVAEYINLLISNQVIDIGAYSTDDSESSGNIATRAVSDITGIEFSRQEIANKALKGSLTVDDVFAGSPAITLYNAIRENDNTAFETASELMNSLFENAIIIPESQVKNAKEMLCYLSEQERNVSDDILLSSGQLNRAKSVTKELFQKYLDGELKPSQLELTVNDYSISNDADEKKSMGVRCFEAVLKTMLISNLHGLTTASKIIEHYKDKIAGEFFPYMNDAQIQAGLAEGKVKASDAFESKVWPDLKALKARDNRDQEAKNRDKSKKDMSDILITNLFHPSTDPDKHISPLKRAELLDKNIAALLIDKENAPIKDRYIKALTLLESRLIAGVEFVDYCRIRLGIPLGKEAAVYIITNYPLTQIYDKTRPLDTTENEMKKKFGLDPSNRYKNKDGYTDLMNAIAQKLDVVHYKVIQDTTSTSVKDVIKQVLRDKKSKGLVIGGGVGAVGTVALAIASAPPLWPIAAGLASAGAVGAGIARAVKKLKGKKALYDRTKFGISGWERVEKLIDAMDANRREILQIASSNDLAKRKENSEIIKAVDDFANKIEKALESTAKMTPTHLEEAYGETESFSDEEITELIECVEEGLKEDKEEYAGLLEATVSLLRPIDVKQITYEPDSTMITPAGYARSRYAYGTVEYDRKENKDRRFNAPLIMTVKFRERYSDGKFDDNELVAVIGILGVITRVPSEEMKYILKANASGTTLDAILKPEENKKDSVGDLLADAKIKKLPQSADVWKSLERVSALAFANRLAGKSTNNISNAHIVFSQKEIDEVRTEEGIDYIRDRKLSAQLLKRYSAMSIMIANDAGERLYTFDDIDSKSWNVAPYSSLIGNNNSDQLITALSRLERNRLG